MPNPSLSPSIDHENIWWGVKSRNSSLINHLVSCYLLPLRRKYPSPYSSLQQPKHIFQVSQPHKTGNILRCYVLIRMFWESKREAKKTGAVGIRPHSAHMYILTDWLTDCCSKVFHWHLASKTQLSVEIRQQQVCNRYGPKQRSQSHPLNLTLSQFHLNFGLTTQPNYKPSLYILSSNWPFSNSRYPRQN